MEGNEVEPRKYVRMHIVKAVEMTRHQFCDIKKTEKVGEDERGYFVIYPDGYESWCPKKQFEDAGRPCDGMTFGMAIEAMKRGKKVCRAGWNGKGMYLWLLPEAEVKREWCKDQMLIAAMGDRDALPCLGSIRMFTADKKVLTGWLASQTDILAEDWQIVE